MPDLSFACFRFSSAAAARVASTSAMLLPVLLMVVVAAVEVVVEVVEVAALAASWLRVKKVGTAAGRANEVVEEEEDGLVF